MTGKDRPVGVVIATRDRAGSLAVTLRRLLALPEKPPVIVADNASSDGTRAMIAERFPRGAGARTAGQPRGPRPQ
jgi:GT2 family glycosyltransferase